MGVAYLWKLNPMTDRAVRDKPPSVRRSARLIACTLCSSSQHRRGGGPLAGLSCTAQPSVADITALLSAAAPWPRCAAAALGLQVASQVAELC